MIPDIFRYDEWYWESEGSGSWWFGPASQWTGTSEYDELQFSYQAWKDMYLWDSGPIRE